MRVLQLLSSGGVYGAEKMVVSLAKGLEQMGCHCILGVLDNLHVESSDVITFMRRQNLPVVVFPCKGKMDFNMVHKIRRCMRSHEIGLVHSHSYKTDFYGYLAARDSKSPILATSHFWTRRTKSLRLYAYIDQFMLRRFNHVVAVSDEIAGEIIASGVPSAKVSVIDNGIDLAAFRNPTPGVGVEFRERGMRIVGAVGRLVDQKGFDFLLRAIPRILERFPGTVFLIAGEGTERAKLEALASELGITGQVYFMGARNDMPNVYASFDVFVLPSLNEGMPIALIEAMATAKPVVATRVAAVPKLVIDGETGLLIEPQSPQALSDAICQLLENSVLRERLGRAARAKVEQQFSSQVMAQRYLKLYRQLQIGLAPAAESELCKI
jgi:glycosyltransferase involved in cell wall biosynthesis